MICMVLKSKCGCDNDCLAPDFTPTIIVALVNPDGDQDLAERVIGLIGERLDQPLITVESHMSDATDAGIDIMDVLAKFPRHRLETDSNFDGVKEVDPDIDFKV